MNKQPLLLHMHIPKTGGSTLNHYIYDQMHDAESRKQGGGYLHAGVYYYPRGFFKASRPGATSEIARVLSRDDLRAVVGHFTFGVHNYVRKPWTYVTMLRHPVDRVVSLYYHLKCEGKLAISLDEFVEEPPFSEVDNDQTRRISGMEPPIGECTADMLDQAIQNLRNHFRVVGVTDRFDEVLAALKLEFNWCRDFVYYLTNTNPARPKTASIPHALQDKVLARNEFDLRLYEFANECLEEKVRLNDREIGRVVAALEAYRKTSSTS
jgi:hypothetical protein